MRAEMNVPASRQLPAVFVGLGKNDRNWLSEHESLICRLARLSKISVDAKIPQGAVQLVHDGATIFLELAKVIDVDSEKMRLSKEIKKAEDEITKLNKKLGNEQFLAKAPTAVIDEQRERLAAEESHRKKLALALDRLPSI